MFIMEQKRQPMMKVSEVAKFLQISQRAVKKLEASGGLIPVRMNKRGDRRYVASEVMEFIKAGGVRQ